MLLTDLLMLTGMIIFCVIWFKFLQIGRDKILWISAGASLFFSLVSISNSRPQAMVGAFVVIIMLVVMLVRKKRGYKQLTKFPAITGTVFLVLAILTYLPVYWFPIVDLPQPSGEYKVGAQNFSVTDTSRKGLLGAASDEPRHLLVRVWYPADNIDGLPPLPYISKAEAASLKANLGQGLPFYNHLVHTRTNSYDGAPLLKGANNLPVVFFSHGYTSFAGQNTILMEELASKGYLVFSIQHSLDSIDTILPNGDVIPTYEKLVEEMMKMMSNDFADSMTGKTLDIRRAATIKGFNKGVKEHYRLYDASVTAWIDDRLFVEHLLASGAVDARIARIARAGDFSRVGHSGMSFGGSTAASVCNMDPNCVAAVNMDGGNFDANLFNKASGKPFMMFQSDWIPMYKQIAKGDNYDYSTFAFNDLSYEQHGSAGSTKDIYRLRVKNVQHLGVSDFTLFFRGPVKSIMAGDIDGHKMVTIINDFVVGFFDKYVRGAEGDFATEAFLKHKDLVIEHKAGKVSDWWNAKSVEERAELLKQQPATAY